ncbi:MAG TPA: PAS domain S-box protein [Terracidiphilus sp.]
MGPLPSTETYRAAFEQVPVGIGIINSGGKYLFVNLRLCHFTGYSREELLCRSFQELTHPDDLPRCVAAFERFAAGEVQSYSIEKRYLCKGGRSVWARLSISRFVDENPDAPLRFIAIIDDITELKRAQELQLTAEEKCVKAFRQSPMAIMITSALTHRYLEVNDAYERLTGYTREEVLGRTPFDLNLWCEPEQRHELADSILAGKNVMGEYRFRARDGRILTALGTAEPIEIDGEPCIIAAALDITERKRLEIELQELSGRLIKTQDEERRRIASELTDSLGQSIAAVSFEVSHLAQTSQGDYSRRLKTISARIQDVTAGLAVISQSLHPASLDYTGLPWSIEVLCRRFMHAYGLSVAFRHDDVPAVVPPDVALCLYRVVQDGLENVLEHSGTRKAWIELTCNQREIHLVLWDKGVGFDAATLRSGLGLLTMRERCRRLNGQITFRSDGGTRIEARIPLNSPDTPLFDRAEE